MDIYLARSCNIGTMQQEVMNPMVDEKSVVVLTLQVIPTASITKHDTTKGAERVRFDLYNTTG